MADADTNTNRNIDSHPTADIYFSDMAASLVDINFCNMETVNCLVLMHCCDEARAGTDAEKPASDRAYAQ